jgi:hypothetical protein
VQPDVPYTATVNPSVNLGAGQSTRARQRRVRQRLQATKALVGVGVLVVVAAVCGALAIGTVAQIVNTDTNQQLANYAHGHGQTTFTSAAGGFAAAFPAKPYVATEAEPLYGATVTAQTAIASLGKNPAESVEVVWLDLPTVSQAANPTEVLAALSLYFARVLGSDPRQGQAVRQGVWPAYDFRVLAPKNVARGDYFVRSILVHKRIYLLRVQAVKNGAEALTALAKSFRLLASS